MHTRLHRAMLEAWIINDQASMSTDRSWHEVLTRKIEKLTFSRIRR
jgi:hypothetical protein